MLIVVIKVFNLKKEVVQNFYPAVLVKLILSEQLVSYDYDKKKSWARSLFGK